MTLDDCRPLAYQLLDRVTNAETCPGQERARNLAVVRIHAVLDALNEAKWQGKGSPSLPELGESASVSAALATIPSRLAEVVRLRYGLGGDGKRRTYKEVAAGMGGLSATRVGQLHEKAMRYLRHPARSRPLLRGFLGGLDNETPGAASVVACIYGYTWLREEGVEGLKAYLKEHDT